MGKADRQKAETMASDNYNRAVSQGNATQSDLQSQLDPARKQAEATYAQASGGYNQYMGPTGAYDPEAYNRVQTQNQTNINTGGYDPTQLDAIRKQETSNTATGGYDPATLNYLKGTSGYQNLIANGGIDPETAGAIRRMAAGSATSAFRTLGTNLARQQSIAGPGGAGGETAEMARQAGQNAATATTEANAKIGQLQQTGKIAGLSGLSQLAGSEAQNRITSTGQEAELETSKARNTLVASQAQQDLANNVAQQRITAAGGLVNLYNSSPGYVNELVKGILQSQQQTGQLTTEQAQIMQQLSQQPGLFDNIMKVISVAGGVTAGVLGGVGAARGKRG